MKTNIIYIFIFVILFACTQDMKNINSDINVKEKPFSSKGFALIYDYDIFEKKIVNKKLSNGKNYVLHAELATNTSVIISNPFKPKSFLTVKVKKTSKIPSIYSVVITREMADLLDLDPNIPYVEVFKVRKNKTFIAKKASIFEEEKVVALKVPVKSIDINDLSISTQKKEAKKKSSLYIIDIADFYFYESAKKAKNRFENEANLLNIKIEKISLNKFKVYSGPYDSFNSMKETYMSLKELGFENINININTNK